MRHVRVDIVLTCWLVIVQSPSTPALFGGGDCVHMECAPMPKVCVMPFTSSHHSAYMCAPCCVSGWRLRCASGTDPPPQPSRLLHWRRIACVQASKGLPEAVVHWGRQRRRYAPYLEGAEFIQLLTCHCVHASGAKFGLAFYGAWVWLLKDWIDTSFMDLFRPSLLPSVTFACRRAHRWPSDDKVVCACS